MRWLLLPLFCLFASPALATGGIHCQSPNNPEIYLSVSTGRLMILAVLSAQGSDGERTYSTRPENDETPIAFGQGMAERDRIAIDFTDDQFLEFAVRLRIPIAERPTDRADATLAFGGGDPIQVVCEFE